MVGSFGKAMGGRGGEEVRIEGDGGHSCQRRGGEDLEVDRGGEEKRRRDFRREVRI